ncbi:hypothetical protein BaRGS_00002299, partial [Batillaria attramentaria]
REIQVGIRRQSAGLFEEILDLSLMDGTSVKRSSSCHDLFSKLLQQIGAEIGSRLRLDGFYCEGFLRPFLHATDVLDSTFCAHQRKDMVWFSEFRDGSELRRKGTVTAEQPSLAPDSPPFYFHRDDMDRSDLCYSELISTTLYGNIKQLPRERNTHRSRGVPQEGYSKRCGHMAVGDPRTPIRDPAVPPDRP